MLGAAVAKMTKQCLGRDKMLIDMEHIKNKDQFFDSMF